MIPGGALTVRVVILRPDGVEIGRGERTIQQGTLETDAQFLQRLHAPEAINAVGEAFDAAYLALGLERFPTPTPPEPDAGVERSSGATR